MSCSIKYSQDTALKIRSPALELGTKTRKAYLDVFSNQIKKMLIQKFQFLIVSFHFRIELFKFSKKY